MVILSSVFILSSKDKPKERDSSQLLKKSEDNEKNPNRIEHNTEDLFLGIILGILTAFLWAIAIVSFNQARIINDDVFVINFIRLIIATIFIAFIGIFQRDFFLGFKKEGRVNLKYYLYIGIAGTLTLGLADTFFYKAAEINGLVFTSTITANTPMVQQIFSIIFLKEKFRKRFIIAVMLIIVGNYIILFL
ncbi:MAG: DMT family transporter [Candidatus Lokiarchaeota archaeon]